MELKKLASEYIPYITKIETHNIYLAGLSEQYLEELLAKYDIKEHLAGFLEDTENRSVRKNEKVDRKISLCGMELPVYPYEYISDLSDDTVVIILNDYFRETYEKLNQRMIAND